MSINANAKAGAGHKRSFNLKITNTNVNVSAELQSHNRNRNYGQSSIEHAELNYQNSHELSWSEDVTTNENIKNQYVKYLSSAIESELIENNYNGLVACLKHEIETPFKISSSENADLVIANKNSKLSVSLEKSNSWTDEQASEQRKIQFVGFRKNKNGSGYQLKVKVTLATRPEWKSDVVAKNGQQQITVRNVNFQAQNIFASAVLEHALHHNGEHKFRVQNAKIEFNGLRYDMNKFDEPRNENRNFAREVGQNLQKIIENGMSAALQKNLYQQQTLCSLNGNDCARCSQQNAPKF